MTMTAGPPLLIIGHRLLKDSTTRVLWLNKLLVFQQPHLLSVGLHWVATVVQRPRLLFKSSSLKDGTTRVLSAFDKPVSLCTNLVKMHALLQI
jgi:hypothetical protein